MHQQNSIILIQQQQMGIEGLLNLLKPIVLKQHISSFKNKTVGIDILPWLYKGCYSDIMEMSDLHIHQSTTYSCSNFLLRMLALLEQNHVGVVFVYDGRSLTMKGETINKRIRARDENWEKTKSMVQNKNVKEAKKYFSRSVRVDESVILESMSILRAKNIKFIVAPYESDCQLAKLYKLGLIDLVITQDSDLLVYECDVLYKLDEEGMCDYIRLSKAKSWDIKGHQNECLKMWVELDEECRMGACILAGCDYVASVRGIGIKKAIKMMNNQPDIMQVLVRLRNDKVLGERVPPYYQENVMKALMIFEHALTYNPITHQLEPLKPISNGGHIDPEMFEVIGVPYAEYLNLNIYRGQANPRTLKLRTITPIGLPENKTVEQTSLTQLRNSGSLPMQQQQNSQSLDSECEMNMFEAYKNVETSMENTLCYFQLNFLNVCVQTLLP